MFTPKFLAIMASCVLSLCFSGTGYAGLIDVKQIVVSSFIPDWLQVSEVVAQETGTAIDLALASNGAMAAGSTYQSGLQGNSPAKAIDGVAPAPAFELFHSATNSASEKLTITLQNVSELDKITIFGRSGMDACCPERDVYNLNLLDSIGNSLFSITGLSAVNASHMVMVMLPNTNPVPIPGAALLFGTGLIGLIGIARRKALETKNYI